MSSVSLNPETGLNESWNDLYKVPITYQGSLSSLNFTGGSTGIHSVPLGQGRTIDFYAKLDTSDILYVSFHGAVIARTGRYPKFWRVNSLKNRVHAFLSISDPTLLLNDNEKFCLAWYTGNRTWDPIEEIADVVLTAMAHAGATRVVFLGGSGGGHAALRFAAKFCGSLAFVQEPQTDVAKYFPFHRRMLLDSCWGGAKEGEVLSSYPERFDMCSLYQATDPDSFVYYRQSMGDPFHLKHHLVPFQLAIADNGGAKAGRYQFVLEGGEVPGHGKITANEFDRHFDAAMEFWENGLARTKCDDSAVSGQLTR